MFNKPPRKCPGCGAKGTMVKASQQRTKFSISKAVVGTCIAGPSAILSKNQIALCEKISSEEGGGTVGKSKKELELENQILREMLLKQSKSTSPKAAAPKPPKKVMYQCRYCGYKSIRNATDGAPTTTANCPKHPRGWCKGVHSWMRTYL